MSFLLVLGKTVFVGKLYNFLFLIIIFFTVFSHSLFAQAGTYYDALTPSASSFITDLETRLRSPYTQVSYDQFDETNVANFASRDTTNGQRVVTCVYSGLNYVYTPPFAWGTFSREHTWCQSWFPTGGATTSMEGSDQNHLFPVEQNDVNGVRSNHPLGVVKTLKSSYLASKLGTDASGITVFEPRDIHKGDAARALLYMAVKYNGVNGYDWTFNKLQTYLTTHSEGPQDVATLLAWNKQDPPDKWEVDRANYIQSIQQNRNPFVDHPEYVNYINFNDLTKLTPTYSTEPTNYATNFTASNGSGALNVSWTDAAPGTQAPSGYLLLAYSKDNYFIPIDGETYTDDTNLSDGTAVVNVPYGTTTYSFSGLTSNTQYYFTIYSYNGTGTLRNYKINGTFPRTNAIYNGTPVVEPTVQASNILVSNITSAGMTLTWTAGNGTSRIVLAHSASAVNSDPVDFTTYTSNPVFGSGSQIGTGNYVVSNGSSNTAIITGLTPSTAYYFKVYEYNGSGGTENYLTSSSASAGFTTLAVTEPTTQASSITFSSVNSTDLTCSWTNGNGVYRIVLAHSGSAVNSAPVDGTTYSASSVFGSGTQLGTGNYVVYSGTGNTVTVTGLTISTTYYFSVYEFNGTTGLQNYLTSSPAAGSQTTTAVSSLNHLIISEVYGAGGNSGAFYKNDYIVLYNPTSSAVALSTWSVQYASATGTSYSSKTTLTGTIGAHSYYLISEASGGSVGLALPTANCTGTINMSGTAGKLALVKSTTVITSKSDANVVDFVGFGTTANEYEGTGPTPAPSTTASIRRVNSGTQDNDDNKTDFASQTLTTNNTPLPVELSSFVSYSNGRSVQLLWETKTEKNSDKFEILRTIAGTNNWEFVAYVKAAVLSNSPKSYSFTELGLPSGKYQYELKMIDNDGTYELSSLVEADISLPQNFELKQNYPNPFNPNTTISYSLPYDSNVKLSVYDALGNLVKVLVNENQKAGYHDLNFNAGNLCSGIYIYNIIASSGNGNKGYQSVKKFALIK